MAGLAVAVPDAPPYDRDDWPHWIDEDGDCQDTRAEVLIAEADGPITLSDDGCSVVAGVWVDVYTDATFTDASDLDVDHLVPLANANNAGGAWWPRPVKREYANDLDNPDALVAVSASANRSKGSRSPDQWKPPDADAWCWYARAWISVKRQWQLAVTRGEKATLSDMLATC